METDKLLKELVDLYNNIGLYEPQVEFASVDNEIVHYTYFDDKSLSPLSKKMIYINLSNKCCSATKKWDVVGLITNMV